MVARILTITFVNIFDDMTKVPLTFPFYNIIYNKLLTNVKFCKFKPKRDTKYNRRDLVTPRITNEN